LNTFIENILELVETKNSPQLRDYCFVFPSKRACHVFKNNLTAKLNGHYILPDILTINEFITRQTNEEVTDEMLLISKLFEVYSRIFKKEADYTFDTFYAYGKQLIGEFDEIDRYMLHAEKIFTYIDNLNKIESSIELTEDKIKFLQEFWQSYLTKEGKETGVKKVFSDEWKLLSKVYYDFRNVLSENGQSYEGNIYRKYTIELEKKPTSIYNKIFFCGFNAFSTSEIRIIKALQKATEVKLIFDIDNYYYKNQNHIAGNFIRFNEEKFDESKIIFSESNFMNNEKRIDFIECKNDVSQIIFLLSNIKMLDNKKTSIILNDESLLPQLFNFNFSNWDNVNISMGFPLIKTQVFKILDELKTLFKSSKISNQKLYLYNKHFLNLLNNGLFSKIGNENSNGLIDELNRKNTLYFPASLLKDTYFNFIFSIFEHQNDFVKLFSQLLQQIYSDNKENQIEKFAIELVQEKIQEVDKEMDILKICSEDIIASITFIQEILSSIKLTFDTNPDADIQIMGLLETRAIDFENIIVLSCNDNFLPGDNLSKFSFIPYLVRKAYDLPTGDEFNSIYSYHFFRLLQRAKNIQLLYVKDEVSFDREESRFIKQLKSDLERFENTSSSYNILSVGRNNIINKTSTSLEKTKRVQEVLEKYRTGEKAFSASSISLYLQNPYIFGLKYGFNIYEAETETEEIDALLFGNILHKSIELLYLPYLNKAVDKEIIKSLSNKNTLKSAIEKSFELYEVENDVALVGVKNKILEDSLSQILIEILEADSQRVPFKIVGLEQTLEVAITSNGGNNYKLKGNIDRIDEVEVNGAKRYCIIDYKTGKTSVSEIKEEEITKYFNSDKKHNFQGMFYALLVNKSNWKKIPMELYFYGVREKVYQPINSNFISDYLIDSFKEKLIEKIEEILNVEIPFEVNLKDKYAENSAYAELLP
jgi:hypothetical protein